MKFYCCIFCYLLAIITIRVSANQNFEHMIVKTLPSIVSVTTYKSLDQNLTENSSVTIPDNLRHLFQAKEKSEIVNQKGTGFFIREDGYIMTCLHIVNNAEKILVALHDQRQYVAQIVSRDSVSDLAIIKIEGKDFSYLQFENRKLPKLGSWVFTIGTPYGFDFSANMGIISALNRHLQIREKSESIPFLQTNMTVSPGDSGSPLLNSSGHVIGVNTHIFTDQPSSIGLSFSVPATYITKSYLLELLNSLQDT